MSKKLTEISPDLTIPGFDVKVKNKHSCQVRSQDGRYEFSVQINEGKQKNLKVSGNIVIGPQIFGLGFWKGGGIEFTTDANDAITLVANLLKLKDKLSSEGFSAKIKGEWLVLSHPSKPDYKLHMLLADARKIAAKNDSLIYTIVGYCGPAYKDKETKTKWKIRNINNVKLVVTNKDFEELAQELKARILSMGEEKDPRITQWVSEEIEKELRSQGFTFTPKPEKGIVDFFHPVGLSGSLSFAPFTVGDLDLNPKYSSLQFPTDIEAEKVVLFTCDRPNYREPYTKGFLAKEPQQVIDEIRGFLALPLVYQEVCHAWKSDILVPKLRHSKMLLVNTELDDKHIILELTQENSKLVLKGMGEELSYPILDTPTGVDTKAIAKDIVVLAEKHVKEFIQETGYIQTTTIVQEIPELDF